MHSVLKDWAEYLAATGSRTKTIQTRTRAIQSLTSHARVEPLDLHRRHVLGWLAGCRSQWTKVTYWASAKAFDAWLTEFEYAELDLLRGIPRPKPPRSVARPIDSDTIAALLTAPLTARARAYVMLALHAALRVHEVAQVRGEHFDHANGWLLVAGKGGFVERVPIHPEISKLADTMPEFGWWFPSRVNPGEHVSAHTVSLTIGAALQSVGSSATAHQLRDTAATEFQRRVKDIRLTQSFLRHQSVQSTQKYTKVDDAALQDAVRATTWPTAA